MKRVLVAMIILSLFFSGCASVPMSREECDLKAKEFISAARKSSIYIFRKDGFSSGLGIPLLVDNKIIGQSEPSVYFRVDVEPGQHKINCEDHTSEHLMLTTGPNQIYFVKQVMENGFNATSCEFYEVTAAEGKDSVIGCYFGQGDP